MKCCDRRFGGLYAFYDLWVNSTRTAYMIAPLRWHQLLVWSAEVWQMHSHFFFSSSNTDLFTITCVNWLHVTRYYMISTVKAVKRQNFPSDGPKETTDISLWSILIQTTDKSVCAKLQWSNDKVCGSVLCFSSSGPSLWPLFAFGKFW